MKRFQKEEGQSAVLIALGLAVLIAFLALAVDGGNVYAQRRRVQNAVDAASAAGGERLAREDPVTHARSTNGQVYAAIRSFAVKNGLDSACVYAPNPADRCLWAYYVTRNSSNQYITDSHELDYYGGSNSQAPITIPTSGGDPVVGVDVSAKKDFNSFFAGIVGVQTFTVSAPSTGYGQPITTAGCPPASCAPPTGACCADEIFPVAIDSRTFTDVDHDGVLDFHFDENDPTYDIILWEKKLSSDAKFVYLSWNGDTSGSTLAANMDDTSRSGQRNAGDWIGHSTATMASSSSVRSEMKQRIGQELTMVVYDQCSPTGSCNQYRISGFARFKINGVCRYGDYTGECNITNLPYGSEPYIQGQFQQWVTSRCEGSCTYYGVKTTKNHPPVTPVPSLIGVVKINKLTPSQLPAQVPVDVVHVLDISGSMKYCIGTTTDCSDTNPNQKLKLAKNALINFNNVISPTLGDRVGLATFPRDVSVSSYSMPCSGYTYNKHMFGQNRTNLTANVSGLNSTINGLSANSGTPLAGGLLIGRGMVLDPGYHNPTHTAVLIVASDGIANVRTTGQWTGFSGSTYSDPPCNQPAVDDAVAQANEAKADKNLDGKADTIVFSIAIGTDFNSDALQAIATEPAENFFYTATDAASMQNIYNQISQTLDDGACTTNAQEVFGAGAFVRVRNLDTGQILQTTATSTGFFQFIDIDPGTYEFISATVTIGGYTYDIFTDKVGGPPLESNPTIEVASGVGTYEVDIALKTDDQICPAP